MVAVTDDVAVDASLKVSEALIVPDTLEIAVNELLAVNEETKEAVMAPDVVAVTVPVEETVGEVDPELLLENRGVLETETVAVLESVEVAVPLMLAVTEANDDIDADEVEEADTVTVAECEGDPV